MNRLVEFTEFISENPRHPERSATYLIDPGQVGAVVPRKKYTSIVVQGYWFHVIGDVDTVLRKLGGFR